MKERGVELKKCIPLDALKWGKNPSLKKIEDIWLHFRDLFVSECLRSGRALIYSFYKKLFFLRNF